MPVEPKPRFSKTPTALPSRWYPPLVLLAAALGLVLRMAWIMHRDAHGNFHWFFDESQYYYSTAVNFFEGRGFFPDYNWKGDGIYVPPPLQSLFLLLVFKVTGGIGVYPAQLIQALLATITIVLSGEIGRGLSSRRCGVLIAFMTALFPPFIQWTAFLTTESNDLFLMVLAVYLLGRWLKNPSWFTALLPAMILGISNLQRPNTLLLGPLLALFSMGIWKNKRGLVSAAIFLLAPPATSLPWLARNLRIYHEPIWVSSNGGILFHFGNRMNLDPLKEPWWDTMNRDHGPTGPWIPDLENKYRGGDGRLKTTWFRYSQAYFEAARSYALRHPFHFFKNYILKFGAQFYLVPRDYLMNEMGIPAPINRLLYHLISLGGTAGLFILLSRNRNPFALLTLLFFLYFALLGALFPPTQDGRMGLYLNYFLLLFFAFLLEALARTKNSTKNSFSVKYSLENQP